MNLRKDHYQVEQASRLHLPPFAYRQPLLEPAAPGPRRETITTLFWIV